MPPQLLLAAIGTLIFGLLVMHFMPMLAESMYQATVRSRKLATTDGDPLKWISTMQRWEFRGRGVFGATRGCIFVVVYLLGFLGLNPLGIR